MSDPETAVISGQLVTSGGEAGPAGATVEVWDSEGPTAAIPDDVPASAMSSDEGDGGSVANEVLGSGRTNEDGRFRVSVSETPDGVFLRSFDDEGALLGTVTVEDLDPTRPVLVPITLPSSGIGWKGPAAGGVALVALASAYGATQWLGDDDSPGGGGTDGADDVGADGAGDGDGTDDDSDDQDDTDDQDDDSPDRDDSDEPPESTSPEINSPNLSGSQVRTPGQQGEFLYTGDDPVQQAVDEEAIDKRVSTILRGRVIDRDGDPLAGATVTVQDHPEFGRTESRDTGLFDMVVNGGRRYVLDVDGNDYLPAQRKREIPPRDTVWLGNVALVTVDTESTAVETNADASQTHHASELQDQDGTRQSSVYFPAGTTASTGNDGSGTPTELEVRATEYTFGRNGPEAMPAELPPATGYTYAVELTAEPTGEDARQMQNGLSRPFLADARGDVEFDQPVALHLENFLDFPVGQAVPTGVLERDDASWDPIDDGRVIEVLEAGDGQAVLDVSGGGSGASRYELEELGIDDDELAALAADYEAGETLWRVRIQHFTPFDCNWPVRPENDEGPDDRCSNSSSSESDESEDR